MLVRLKNYVESGLYFSSIVTMGLGILYTALSADGYSGVEIVEQLRELSRAHHVARVLSGARGRATCGRARSSRPSSATRGPRRAKL